MDSNDFNKLISLLSKLDNATNKAKMVDGSFRKYHTQSIEILKDMPVHLKKIEQGLRTAQMLK
ncbi:MAG: 2,3-bisphosphoglycerate-independent phosphoglycerate mutase [Polaribacter sp.]|jgi:2,3-bisphosphoglycerate-independent phosphoglycerate mutase